MEFVNLPFFAVSALVFASLLTGLFSTRVGFNFLLEFLLAGILAGVDGIGGYRFDNHRLNFWVASVCDFYGLPTSTSTSTPAAADATLGAWRPAARLPRSVA